LRTNKEHRIIVSARAACGSLQASPCAASNTSKEDDMAENIWVTLTPRELTVIFDALTSMRNAGRMDHAEFDALAGKLAHGTPPPRITIEVRGGMVECTRGNPFPIRIRDYDGHDLPDVDERGEHCDTWLVPADEEIEGVERSI
jgi:hypothetical protein